MKKIIFSLLIVLLCVFTAGCNNNRENDSFEIPLYSNSSTGYSWSEELSEEGIVEISSRYDNSGCDEGVAGCGGEKIYTVKALKPGKVTLTLTYQFVDPDKDRDKLFAIYNITVDKNLNITEEHSGNYFEVNN